MNTEYKVLLKSEIWSQKFLLTTINKRNYLLPKTNYNFTKRIIGWHGNSDSFKYFFYWDLSDCHFPKSHIKMIENQEWSTKYRKSKSKIWSMK